MSFVSFFKTFWGLVEGRCHSEAINDYIPAGMPGISGSAGSVIFIVG
jgi:hypothetical protein